MLWVREHRAQLHAPQRSACHTGGAGRRSRSPFPQQYTSPNYSPTHTHTHNPVAHPTCTFLGAARLARVRAAPPSPHPTPPSYAQPPTLSTWVATGGKWVYSASKVPSFRKSMLGVSVSTAGVGPPRSARLWGGAACQLCRHEAGQPSRDSCLPQLSGAWYADRPCGGPVLGARAGATGTCQSRDSSRLARSGTAAACPPLPAHLRG